MGYFRIDPGIPVADTTEPPFTYTVRFTPTLWATVVDCRIFTYTVRKGRSLTYTVGDCVIFTYTVGDSPTVWDKVGGSPTLCALHLQCRRL